MRAPSTDPELYRFVVPTRSTFSEWDSDPILHAKLVIVRQDSVCIQSGTRVQGKARKSGKAFTHWKNVATIVSWRSGRLISYSLHSEKRRRFLRQTTSSAFAANGANWGQDILDAVAERHAGRGLPEMKLTDANEAIHSGAFPLVSALGWNPRQGLATALRTTNVQDFTRAAFGATNYRRDLVKAIGASKNLDMVSYAKQFKGVVPIDWLIERIKLPWSHSGVGFSSIYGVDYVQPDAKGLADLFKILAPATARRLLFSEATDYTIRDTITAMRNLGKEGETNLKYANWRDLHDDFTKQARAIGKSNRAIPQTKIAEKLDGLEVGSFTIQSAKQTSELDRWGEAMSNCIGGYGNAAIQGRSNLFGVYEGDALIANMDVRGDKSISQLFARFNRNLPTTDDSAIRDAVRIALAPRARKLVTIGGQK